MTSAVALGEIWGHTYVRFSYTLRAQPEAYMPNYNLQQPQTNYAARASGRLKKRGGPGALILLILLLAGAAFLFRDRLSWFAHVFTSEPATVTQNPSQVENAQPPVPQPKLKPRKLAEAERPSSANSGTNEQVTRPMISVEVMYPGGRRRTIYPHDATVNLDLGGSKPRTSPPTQPAAADTIAGNAAEHEPVSGDTPEVLSRPSKPIYPRLAEEMKVEGSVVLQVNIDKVGNIVGTQVLSGPAILAAAAQEAVRQWRFRPHYKNGAPIETEAHVVVNFTISTR
jgi:protein TonB